MTNAATFNIKDLHVIAGQGTASLPSDLVITGISTDTRTLVPGNAFVALRGENFDGHDHIAMAFSKGAVLAVIDEHRFPDYKQRWPGCTLLPSADTLHTLGSFAWYHRRRFDIPVIAIGGAAGKTSTKEITAHVLGTVMNVLKTQANYNNRIGTPLTLLQLDATHDVAVIEVGTNEPGEIEVLSAMVQPTHALITNIGKEHLEKLIDIDGVEKEETALFDYTSDHDGLRFVNMDDERLQRFGYDDVKGRVVTFGIDHESDIMPHISFDTELHPVLHLVKGTATFRAALQTIGLAAAYNAVSATAIAWSMNMSAGEIKHALETYAPEASHGYARMTVEQANGLVIMNDTYNANPESMTLSLKTLSYYPADRRIAVLGDMRELGDAAEEEHQAILELALQNADLVVVHGEEFQKAVLERDSAHAVYCDTHLGCAEIVMENTHPGSVVLVKGSRGMKMEHVVEHLLNSDQ